MSLVMLMLVVVPIGGGGIISGIAIAMKEIKPSIKIIGVQAEVIASTRASLDAGKIVTLTRCKVFSRWYISKNSRGFNF
ncbi:MAG: hypothetical protein KatS3mg079_356 [Caloramator sp.]|nr:MAG: hypothetical protein KatS3mg079_356 [Caloramator sp.]